ncbi:MAG TPA: hypothetical protein VFS37_04475 [Conexibacter sp.]|nr:hypothetical protein [Conexibacter sp.]
MAPDYVTPGGLFFMFLNVQNVGDRPMDGLLTVRTHFPDGIAPADLQTFNSPNDPQCQTVGQDVECTIDVTGVETGVQLRYRIDSTVDGNASGPLPGGSIEVAGGGSSDDVTEVLDFTAGTPGPFALRGFDVGLSPTVTGLPSARAGSDPTEITTRFASLSETRATFGVPVPFVLVIAPTENFRDVTVHVPPGLVGNPTASPVRCTQAQLAAFATVNGQRFGVPACPPESQVGLAQLNTGDIVGVFNVEPPPGSPAAFGFFYNSIVVTLLARVRPSDNGIDIVAQKSVSSVPLPKVEVTLWGAPTDPSHDHLRGICLQGGAGYAASSGDCSLRTRNNVPFLRTPTSCPGTPLLWSIDLTTYQNPNRLVHRETTSPAIEGCQHNPFDPSFALVPSTSAPHAPSGVDATLLLDQDWSVNGIAPADLRRASVTLPEGLTINPSSADGLAACTDAQLGFGREGPATCPDAAKLGTVTLHTPLLDHEVGGTIYLRTQNSNDPMSGELFRLAVEIRSDQDGLAIKLPGAIQVDPTTGRLTTVFDNLPQLPFEAMTLHFKQGPRAPLASPNTCGTHTTTADLLSWGDAPRHIETSFTTTGCKAPQFDPTLRAGVEQPVAGSSSPFHVSLNRTDDDSEFSGLTINTPRGLLARVKDAAQCASAAADTGSCPAASQIGHATVAAGVGSNPFWVGGGRVYLTGPYRGAPYGLAVAVDAVAGPFNLGTVVVRQAIHVDPITAQLSVVSDPFPTIVKGVPLHIRSVRVAVDKPRFMVAPTNCSTQSVGGTATATDGLRASLTSRFKVGGCKDLAFAPKLELYVGSKGHTNQRQSTPFKAVLTQRPGQSNLRSVKVALPQTLAALLNVVNRACTLAEYKSDRCRKAEAGSAVARTPLLKDPLKGGVFFVRHPGRPLPDLMVALRGEIDIDLVGRVTIPGGTRLATNFDAIPDAPVTKFTLKLVAGSHGPLGVSARSLCSARSRRATAFVEMKGQNGDSLTRRPLLHIRGCGK